jgi:hypothetical protein
MVHHVERRVMFSRAELTDSLIYTVVCTLTDPLFQGELCTLITSVEAGVLLYSASTAPLRGFRGSDSDGRGEASNLRRKI